MILLAGDLATASSTFFGFGETEQQMVLEALEQFT